MGNSLPELICDDFESGICKEGVILSKRRIVSPVAKNSCPWCLQPGCSCEHIIYDENDMPILPLKSRLLLLKSGAFGNVGFDDGKGATVLE